GAKNNTIIGNYIGTNSASDLNLGNTTDGVRLDGGSSLTSVGGLDASERNIISGNEGRGIDIVNSGGNTILGNYIGTTVNGAEKLGNAIGITVEGTCPNNTIDG